MFTNERLWECRLFRIIATPILISLIFPFSIAHALESNAITTDKKLIQKQEVIKQSTSSRIDSFLQDILKAKTFAEVGEKYQKYNFSNSESKKIEKLTSRGKYSEKLNKLVNKGEKTDVAVLTRQSKKRAKQEMQTAHQARQQKLLEMNRLDIKLGRQPGSKQTQKRKYNTPSISGEPKISALSSQVITPGGNVMVSGENFGPLKGRLSVKIGKKTLHSNILHWRDDIVAFNIDKNISGLLSADAMLTVITASKKEVKWPLRFIPTKVDRHLSHWYSLLHPAPLPRFLEIRPTICECKLENEWQVVEYWRERQKTGIKARCGYDTPPVKGSNSTSTKIWLKAWPFSAVRCTYNVIISGPKGTKPYSGSCC